MGYTGCASIMPWLIRVGRQPALSSSTRHCPAVRSRPPAIVSISRSSHFAPSGELPGSITLSNTTSRSPAAARTVSRIRCAEWSSQS